MRDLMMVLSAEVTAAWRAAESERPQAERICCDPMARDFLCVNPILRTFAVWMAGRRLPGALPALAARTAYIDDCLGKCIDDGIEQVVNLGAGFDSRAYRFGQLKGRVRVFEIEHPATLKAKMNRVAKIVGSLPDHVVYVPVDFNAEKLDRRLFESGDDKDAKTLSIAEAIVHHLRAEEVEGMLDFVAANSGRGSSIVFDYIYQSVMDGTNEWKGTGRWQSGFKRSDGYPPFGIEEGNAGEVLSKRGFHDVQDVPGELLRDRYARTEDQRRSMFTLWGIAHARVAPRT